MHLMGTTRNPRRNLLLSSRIQILRNCVTGVVNPTAKNMNQYAEHRMLFVMVVTRKVIFRLFASPLASFHTSRNLILPIESKHITFQKHQLLESPAPTGFYNEQGNQVSEPPRHTTTNPAVYSLSVVIKDIQDIQPEIDPELLSLQGMRQSQIPFRETKQMFNSSKKQFHSHTGYYPTEFNQILQFLHLTGFPAISKRSKHSAISKCF